MKSSLIHSLVTAVAMTGIATEALSAGCNGNVVRLDGERFLELEDSSLATMARMHVNVDGASRAYHRLGYEAGAIIHLCNAGEVHLPDGNRYHGSESNAVCTGKFLEDVARIEAAGWDDPTVGLVRWYGILGTGEATIAGRQVKGIEPVYQPDGSGFFVSPTKLEDANYDVEDQRRYIDVLTVPHVVVRRNSGMEPGTFGVSWRVEGCPSGNICDPVPFIVGDIGPRAGEGSVYLSRAVNGLDAAAPINRGNRYDGSIDNQDVLFVFFGGSPQQGPYDAQTVTSEAGKAFRGWGGLTRLNKCLQSEIPDAR